MQQTGQQRTPTAESNNSRGSRSNNNCLQTVGTSSRRIKMKIFLLSAMRLHFIIFLQVCYQAFYILFSTFLFATSYEKVHTQPHKHIHSQIQIYINLFCFLMYDSCGIPWSKAEHQQETRKLTLGKCNRNKRNHTHTNLITKQMLNNYNTTRKIKKIFHSKS